MTAPAPSFAQHDPRARAIARDLLASGITAKHLRRALGGAGFHPATARALLTEWAPQLRRVEVREGHRPRFEYYLEEAA